MPGLVTHEGHAFLGGEVNEWLSADVHRRAHDRAAGEAPGRAARAVVGDWFCTVFPGVEALAGDEELAGLRLDAALSYLFLACVEVRVPSAGLESPSRSKDAGAWTRASITPCG